MFLDPFSFLKYKCRLLDDLLCREAQPLRFVQLTKLNVADLCATVPPAGVFAVAGCGADILINICLTILGYVESFS